MNICGVANISEANMCHEHTTSKHREWTENTTFFFNFLLRSMQNLPYTADPNFTSKITVSSSSPFYYGLGASNVTFQWRSLLFCAQL